MDENFWQLAKMMAAHSPEMVISFLGIVLSFASWNKYPRPALLSFLGFALVLGSNFAMGGILLWYLITNPGWNIFWFVTFGVRSCLNAGGYLLLICAIYASRKPKAPVPPMA